MEFGLTEHFMVWFFKPNSIVALQLDPLGRPQGRWSSSSSPVSSSPSKVAILGRCSKTYARFGKAWPACHARPGFIEPLHGAEYLYICMI